MASVGFSFGAGKAAGAAGAAVTGLGSAGAVVGPAITATGAKVGAAIAATALGPIGLGIVAAVGVFSAVYGLQRGIEALENRK